MCNKLLTAQLLWYYNYIIRAGFFINERRYNMATVKEPTVSFKKADIEHTLGILYQLQGFLEAKLQTGKAAQVEEVISILRKDG